MILSSEDGTQGLFRNLRLESTPLSKFHTPRIPENVTLDWGEEFKVSLSFEAFLWSWSSDQNTACTAFLAWQWNDIGPWIHQVQVHSMCCNILTNCQFQSQRSKGPFQKSYEMLKFRFKDERTNLFQIIGRLCHLWHIQQISGDVASNIP